MAPQQSEVDTIDVITAASSDETTHDPLPQQNLPKAELRMENVRRVRDEADSLRQEICQLRIRLEEVEEESKFHAAKANELTELLMNSNNGNGVDETALKQSEALAKKDCQIESLEKKITKLETEKALLGVERDNAKKEMVEMSKVVRSLQNVAKGSPDNSYHEYDDEEDDEDDESEDEAVVLTPDTALDLTLGNLKDHIEMLEDGLQASSNLNSTQKNAISSLQQDIKAQQAQIGMLEALFKDLNAADRIEMMKKQQEAEAKMKEDASNDSAAKGSIFGSVFSVKKSSKATEETATNDDSTENSQEDSTPKEDSAAKAQSYFGSVFSSKKSQKTTEEDASNDDSTPQEDAKAKASYFDSVFSSKLTSTKDSRKPDIPTSALAAKHAAEILLGSNSAEVPKKEKRTKMKKVKIKFKKAGLEGTYTGPLVDKKPHGIGTIRFTNGNTYLGEMTRGKMSGSGTLYTKNGVFRGLFENNRYVGESGDEASDNDENKPSDVTATTTTEMDNSEGDNKAANAMAALELDAFSPSNIDDVIDDSFNMMVNLDGMERKAELAEMKKSYEREANESFLKEFSGSEHSSSMGALDESNNSSLCEGQDVL